MKIVVLDNLSSSLVNFRGPLLETLRASPTVEEVEAWCPDAEPAAQQWLTQRQIPLRLYPLKRTGSQIRDDLLTLHTLRRMMGTYQPDLVLNYTVKPVIYGSIAAYLQGVSRMYSVITGLSPAYANLLASERRWSLRVQRWLYSWALPLNNSVFFYNADDRSLFYEDGLLKRTQESHILDGSGVCLETFQPAPLPQKPHFVMIARLIRHKGVREYANAARQLKKRYPEATFSLLGAYMREHPDSIPEQDLEKWQREGLVYHGQTDDVRPYLRQASVCVLPSYREGIPRCLLEAMAMGRPVIATDVPGCREVVQDQRNGLLVPAQETFPLLTAMSYLLERPHICQKWGQEGRLIVEQRFDVRHINRTLLEHLGL